MLSVGDWLPRLALNDVQLDCEFEFESVELEREGTGRRFDRPCSDADSDAHAVAFFFMIGVDDGVHELFTPRKLRCPARLRSQRWVDKRKLLESELMDCGRARERE